MMSVNEDPLTKSEDTSSSLSSTEERDEVKEIRKVSRKDTFWVKLWRFLVTSALLTTAIVVTLETFNHLREAENKNFETAFNQFARTLGNAEVDHQRKMRQAYRALAETISSSAKVSGAVWPYYILPRYEMYAHNVWLQGQTELVTILNRVKQEERSTWEDWYSKRYSTIVAESYEIESKRLGDQVYDSFDPIGYSKEIQRRTKEGFIPDIERPEYFVSVNFSPPPMSYKALNYNMHATVGTLGINAFQTAPKIPNEFLLSAFRLVAGTGLVYTQEEHEAKHSHIEGSSVVHPHTSFVLTVHEDPDDAESEVVGLVQGLFAWDAAMQNLLPDNVHGIYAVLRNTCNQTHTYRVDGSNAFYQGEGDLSEESYRTYRHTYDLSGEYINADLPNLGGHCMYAMDVYPSSRFQDAYDTDTPEIFAVIIASTFFVVIAVFFIYDLFVQARNEKLVNRAAQSNAIVSNVFPSAIRDRLIGENATEGLLTKKAGSLKKFMKNGNSESDIADPNTKPLADIFLECSIMFADIVGFTAWSSTREPSQVFLLLESLYGRFDQLAKKHQVFKVETVGDCYVAAAGIPDPRNDHAVMICRYARAVLLQTERLVKHLEKSLGPDTGDLSVRIGIHSGPVTAGVLRGERARFQLFGDTMNTTARIESLGKPGQIHVSQVTANFLMGNGKEKWIEKRADLVAAKGKGLMQTYWLIASTARSIDKEDIATVTEDSQFLDSQDLEDVGDEEERTARLVDWFVKSFASILKQIVALRTAKAQAGTIKPINENDESLVSVEQSTVKDHHNFFDEVREIIVLPEFDKKADQQKINPDQIEIGEAVLNQLKDYVSTIASMYRKNDFHNFEHASHVTLSVLKLLSRITAPTESDDTERGEDAAMMHDYTYGITSEPMMQFACSFASLIHDVDHTGAPNAQLIKEKATIAELYNNCSIAEQNSLDLSWNLLMEDRFKELRSIIYTNEAELRRFRELVVNSVMATDIVDKQLKQLRNGRWEKAFKMDFEESTRDAVNRKATIVIEHLIQASDVSHTMQHWHIYRKWNERFFLECYKAYIDGRAEKDPTGSWYKGEIGFFDFYIIPLAKKLKECGVFGKSSGEYLSYAIDNRQEWEQRGQDMTSEMAKKARKLYGTK